MKLNEEKLPIKGNLKVVYILSVLIACIFVFTSVYGILLGSSIYPTEELFNNFISNDFVNLLIGLPIILVSIVFTFRCKLVGLLFLPGSLLFIIYNYMIYILAIPLNWVIPFYLILIISSLYAIIKLFTSINGEKIQKLLKGVVHERISGTILIGLGLLFMIQAASAIIELIIDQIQITGIELAVHISDFAISPFLIIGGTLLLRRKTFGYVSGLGLLFQASMLFIGLIVFLIIEPLLTTTPFPIVDIIVVSIMGLISFIPLTLFIRGVNEKDNSSISKS
ncbi:MAG: hypothetical protein P8X91_07485 [Candidatus Bathyarchaeota archaeon]